MTDDSGLILLTPHRGTGLRVSKPRWARRGTLSGFGGYVQPLVDCERRGVEFARQHPELFADGMPPALVQFVIDTTPAGHDITYSGPSGSGVVHTPPPSQERMSRAVDWVSANFLGKYGVNMVADRWDPPRVEVSTTGDALALATLLPAKVDGIAVSVYRGSQIRPYWGSKPDPLAGLGQAPQPMTPQGVATGIETIIGDIGRSVVIAGLGALGLLGLGAWMLWRSRRPRRNRGRRRS